MAGTLCHAKQFAQQVYRSKVDGELHYELVPVDGDYDFPSWTTWEGIEKRCVWLSALLPILGQSSPISRVP